jgi:uncharacterized protein YndB with AHSA1/START domain
MSLSMRTVHVEKSIAAPAGEVFEMLTDHAGYTRFRGVRSAELVREGETERNGTGAMRRLLIGPVRFEEEITGFDRPRRMDYLIRDISIPFEHEGGTIAVEGGDERADVVWMTTFRVPARFAEGPATAVVAFAVRRGIERMLAEVERRLAS